MSLRKDAKTLALVVAFIAQLAQADIEVRVGLLDSGLHIVNKEQQATGNPAVGYRAEAQAMARYETMEMTPSRGAVLENAYPDTGMTVSLEKMEAEKKGLERLAHELEGADRVLEDFEIQERQSLEE